MEALGVNIGYLLLQLACLVTLASTIAAGVYFVYKKLDDRNKG